MGVERRGKGLPDCRNGESQVQVVSEFGGWQVLGEGREAVGQALVLGWVRR